MAEKGRKQTSGKKRPVALPANRAAAEKKRRINPYFDLDREQQLRALKRFRGGNFTSILSELISTRYADLKKLYPDAKELDLDAD